MRAAGLLTFAVCLLAASADTEDRAFMGTRAGAGVGMKMAEESMAEMYKLRSHSHKRHHHKLSHLPRFAEQRDGRANGIFGDVANAVGSSASAVMNGAAQAGSAVANGVGSAMKGAANMAANAGAKMGYPTVGMTNPGPHVQPMPADPVDFPPRGVGNPPADGNKAHLFVPFGKAIPRKPYTTYYTASGAQECKICKYIIDNMKFVGTGFYELCNGMWPEYMPMCHAQQKTLQGCPEFTQGWCYQDLGGSQVLRSPCPYHLTCHYCLGVNPIQCIEP